VRAHLATHAAKAERLDDHLQDAAFLLAVDPDRLSAAIELSQEVDPLAGSMFYTLRQYLQDTPTAVSTSYLQMLARQFGLDGLATSSDELTGPMSWRTRWADWTVLRPQRVLGRHDSPVSALHVVHHSDSLLVVSGDQRGQLKVWDADHASAAASVPQAHEGTVTAITSEFVNGGDIIITGCSQGSVRFWRLDDGSLTLLAAKFRSERGIVHLAVTSLNGKPAVMSYGAAGQMTVWGLDGFEVLHELSRIGRPDEIALQSEPDRLVSTAVDPGSSLLLISCTAGLIEAVDLDAHVRYADSSPAYLEVSALSAIVVPEGVDVHVGRRDGTVQLLRLRGSRVETPRNVAAANRFGVSAIASWNRPSTGFALGGADGQITVWNDDFQRTSPVLSGHRMAVTGLTFGHRNKYNSFLFSGGEDGTVRAWNLRWQDLEVRRGIKTVRGITAACSTSTDGRDEIAVLGQDNGALQLVSTKDGTSRPVDLRSHGLSVRAVSALRIEDSRLVVASAGSDDTVMIQTTLGGAASTASTVPSPPRYLPVDNSGADCIALANWRGEVHVAYGGSSGSLFIQSLGRSNASVRAQGQPSGGITAVCVAALDDHLTILTCGSDGLIKLWRFTDRLSLIGAALAHEDGVVCAALVETGAGPVAITAGGRGEVRSWSIGEEKLVGGGLIASVNTGVSALAVTRSGADGMQRIILGTPDGVAFVPLAEPWEQTRHVNVGANPSTLCALDDKAVLVGSESGVVIIETRW
jgi:WD40 repeat protein